VIVGALLAGGWTMRALAARCGTGKTTVNRIARDPRVEPRYSVGAVLLELYVQAAPVAASTMLRNGSR
jgi:transcriptional regulator with XRE-family HTH domain